MKKYTLIFSLVSVAYFCEGQALHDILKQAEANYSMYGKSKNANQDNTWP